MIHACRGEMNEVIKKEGEKLLQMINIYKCASVCVSVHTIYVG